jgi:hypothetical protein
MTTVPSSSDLDAIYRDSTVAGKIADVFKTGEEALYLARVSVSLKDITSAFDRARIARNEAKAACAAMTATPTAKQAFYAILDKAQSACDFAERACNPDTVINIMRI